MKVTRLKSGYRITLSDSEMGMLRHILVDGIASTEGMEDWEIQLGWTAAEKAALTRRAKATSGTHYNAYGLLAIDEDRRAALAQPEAGGDRG